MRIPSDSMPPLACGNWINVSQDAQSEKNLYIVMYRNRESSNRYHYILVNAATRNFVSFGPDDQGDYILPDTFNITSLTPEEGQALAASEKGQSVIQEIQKKYAEIHRAHMPERMYPSLSTVLNPMNDH
ncbi:MAG TPA: hypothetical protein VLE95_08435 [Chlamydiales bacterium]|nr:hypothetical protein [Chlamydiales bacterium]